MPASTAAAILAAQELGAVAHHAGDHRQCVHHRVGDLLIAAPVQIGDPRPRSTAGADGPAVGGEAADAGLLVDGDKVGNGQRAVELLAGRADVAGIGHDGHAGRDALIAGAGEDDDGHFAAAHAGVRARGRIGLGPLLDIIPVILQ